MQDKYIDVRVPIDIYIYPDVVDMVVKQNDMSQKEHFRLRRNAAEIKLD